MIKTVANDVFNGHYNEVEITFKHFDGCYLFEISPYKHDGICKSYTLFNPDEIYMNLGKKRLSKKRLDVLNKWLENNIDGIYNKWIDGQKKYIKLAILDAYDNIMQ